MAEETRGVTTDVGAPGAGGWDSLAPPLLTRGMLLFNKLGIEPPDWDGFMLVTGTLDEGPAFRAANALEVEATEAREVEVSFPPPATG